MKMKHYVYENWLHDKAITHKTDCSFCNEGKGRFPDKKYNSKYGLWRGPFKSHQEAKLAAIKTKRAEVHDCGHCFKKKS